MAKKLKVAKQSNMHGEFQSHPSKVDLNIFQQLFVNNLVSVADYVRNSNIDLKTITLEELIALGKKV